MTDSDYYEYDADDERERYEAEVAEKAIAEFTADRLKSYYVDHPELAAPAYLALEKAKGFLPSEPEAALVFAYSAIEMALKAVLLKPVVYGLVHTEAVATVVMSLIGNGGVGVFRDLLFGILELFGGVNLKTLKRDGAGQLLWEEIERVRKARNHVMHAGGPANPKDACLGLDVASEILGNTFPTVMKKLGLHLHGSVICQKYHGEGFAPG
jgi:hypothetical protein